MWSIKGDPIIDSQKVILDTITQYLSAILIEHNLEKAISFIADEMVCYDVNKSDIISTKEDLTSHILEKIWQSKTISSFYLSNYVINVYDNMAVFFGKVVIVQGASVERSLQQSVTLRFEDGWKICANHYSLHDNFEKESWGFSSENIAGGILSGYIKDDKFPLCFINDDLVQLLGYTQKEFEEKIGDDILQIVYPADRERVVKEVEAAINNGTDWIINHRVLTKDKQLLHTLVRGRKHIDAIGRPVITNFSIDMTELYTLQEQVAVQAEELEAQNEELMAQNEELVAQSSELILQAGALALSEKKYRLALSKTNHIIFDYNMKDKTFHYNNLLDESIGITIPFKEVVHCLIPNEVIIPEDISLLERMIKEIESGSHTVKQEIHTLTASGEYKWYQFLLTSVLNSDGYPVYALGTAEDITNQKKNELDLRKKAEYDLLTSVYNKISALEKIKQKLATADGIASGSFIILDIDCFKSINDECGHPYGDQVLQQIAQILRESFRQTDIIGRMGGDEFCIYFDNIPNIQLIEEKAQLINHKVRSLTLTAEMSYPLSVSIGLSTCSGTPKNFEQIYREADQALYFAKKKGKDTFHIYNY